MTKVMPIYLNGFYTRAKHANEVIRRITDSRPQYLSQNCLIHRASANQNGDKPLAKRRSFENENDDPLVVSE